MVLAPPAPPLPQKSVAPPPYALICGPRVRDAKELFDNLPVDPYVEEGIRYKLIFRCNADVKTGKLTTIPPAPFFQSSKINPNPKLANIARVYGSFLPTPDIEELILFFAKERGILPKKEIFVHAQRTKAKGAGPASTTVEGFHRDGVDSLGIYCAGRHNVTGGVTMLRDAQTQILSLSYCLNEGECVFLDDSKYLHYATPIAPEDISKPAWRDILVLGSPED